MTIAAIAPNPILPLYDPSWLYVPRGHINVPTGGGTPPVTGNYLLLENLSDISLENGSGFVLLES